MNPAPPPALWPGRRAVVVHDEEAVARALDRMARELEARLAPASGVLLLGLLTGGAYASVWLSTRLRVPHRLEFLRLGRYGRGETGGAVVWAGEPPRPSPGTAVVVVDDIFDEGLTLAAVRERLAGGDREVLTAVLARKARPRPPGLPEPDVVGLEVPDEWIVGCGLDCDGLGRHYPALYALRTEPAPQAPVP